MFGSSNGPLNNNIYTFFGDDWKSNISFYFMLTRYLIIAITGENSLKGPNGEMLQYLLKYNEPDLTCTKHKRSLINKLMIYYQVVCE